MIDPSKSAIKGETFYNFKIAASAKSSFLAAFVKEAFADSEIGVLYQRYYLECHCCIITTLISVSE